MICVEKLFTDVASVEVVQVYSLSKSTKYKVAMCMVFGWLFCCLENTLIRWLCPELDPGSSQPTNRSRTCTVTLTWMRNVEMIIG